MIHWHWCHCYIWIIRLWVSTKVCHLHNIIRLFFVVRDGIHLVSWSLLAKWCYRTWYAIGWRNFFWGWLLCWWLLHFIRNSNDTLVSTIQERGHFVVFIASHRYINWANLFWSLRWLNVLIDVPHEFHYMSLYCVITSSNSFLLNCWGLPALHIIFVLSCLNCF